MTRRAWTWLTTAWLVSALLALLLIGWPRMTVSGQGFSQARTVFTVVNAVSLSGLPQIVGVDQLKAPARAALALTMLLSAALWLAAGATLARRILCPGLPARIVVRAMALYAAVACVLALAGLAWTGGLVNLVSLVTHSGTWTGAAPTLRSPWWWLGALPLGAWATLGMPCLMCWLAGREAPQALVTHARATLAGLSVAFLVFTAALTPTLATAMPWRDGLALGASLGAGGRTLGLPIGYATDWPRATQWLLLAGMLVGGGSASLAGGLKVTAIGELLSGLRAAWRGQAPGRAAVLAAAWLGVLVGMVGLTTLALLVSEPQMPGDRVLFLAASAVSNAGLAHDPVTVGRTGLYLLSAAMLSGRIAPLLMLWWQARAAPGSQRLIA